MPKPMAPAASMFPSPQRHHPPATSSSPPLQPTLGLSRYGSAPGSFLSGIADADVRGGTAAAAARNSGASGAAEVAFMGRFFTGEPSSSSPDHDHFRSKDGGRDPSVGTTGPGLPRPSAYGMSEYAISELTVGTPGSGSGGGGGGGPLVRHSSSPAGFLSPLVLDNGFPVTRDQTGSYGRSGAETSNTMGNRRALKSQLSFSNRHPLSQISELGDVPDVDNDEGVGRRRRGHSNSDVVDASANGAGGHSYIASNFAIGSWDDTNSIVFSAPSGSNKHFNKDNINGDIITISNLDSQYGSQKSSMDMATLEKYLQLQHDLVPFKVRAKRGCATHPRSIAERERRTRISEKLRKLQELVPNMDKQTNTADMLDLAVQHIKGLKSQVQILTQERDNCTCSNNKERK